MSRRWKLYVFTALVESNLLYGLDAACLIKAEQKRLDGFQAGCLRVILGIPSAYISRISNKHVLETAGVQTAGTKLLQRQFQLWGKVMRSPVHGPLQSVSFIPGTMQPATTRYVRRVGRPKKEWIPSILAASAKAMGGIQRLLEMCHDTRAWKEPSLSM